MEDQIENAKRGDVNMKQDDVPRPEPIKEEKIVDLDDYMKEKGMHLAMKNKDKVELEDPKLFEDENTVAMSYKKKTVGENKNKKKDGLEHCKLTKWNRSSYRQC